MVRLPSPRDLVGERRDRSLVVVLQQDPVMSKLVKESYDSSDHVLDPTLVPDRRDAHERLRIANMQGNDHGIVLRAVQASSGPKNMGSSCISGIIVLLPVMGLHRKTFDAMVAETDEGSVCHLACRACTVVSESR